MEFVRQVVVFDAADLEAESTFGAGMLGGRVLRDRRGTASSTQTGDG